MFVERNFYFYEDSICKSDSLSYPCSIKNFDYGIVLFPEMVVYDYDSLGVTRFQIAQLKGYFYFTRRDPV